MVRGRGSNSGPIGLNEMQDIIINYSPFAIWIPRAMHSLQLVGQNAVESSTIVAILFAFIPNQYDLISQS